MQTKIKREKKQMRQRRVRGKVQGSKDKPRLCVFRSNKNIYIQLIDDESGKTLLGMSDALGSKKKSSKKPPKASLTKGGKENKTQSAYALGVKFAKKAIEKKIKVAIFDRGGYKYHGRVKAVADGAREGGLIF